jgi:hypothetical protein
MNYAFFPICSAVILFLNDGCHGSFISTNVYHRFISLMLRTYLKLKGTTYPVHVINLQFSHNKTLSFLQISRNKSVSFDQLHPCVQFVGRLNWHIYEIVCWSTSHCLVEQPVQVLPYHTLDSLGKSERNVCQLEIVFYVIDNLTRRCWV